MESKIFTLMIRDYQRRTKIHGGGKQLSQDLNRIEYVIINIMLKNYATDHMHSMSCEEIRDIEGRSKISTIYKHIRKLENLGLVTKGAKIERAYGYILTNKAIGMIPKSDKTKEDL